MQCSHNPHTHMGASLKSTSPVGKKATPGHQPFPPTQVILAQHLSPHTGPCLAMVLQMRTKAGPGGGGGGGGAALTRLPMNIAEPLTSTLGTAWCWPGSRSGSRSLRCSSPSTCAPSHSQPAWGSMPAKISRCSVTCTLEVANYHQVLLAPWALNLCNLL